MGDKEKEKPFDWITEGGRFKGQPACTNLTGECARRYLKALREKPPDKVEVKGGYEDDTPAG